MTNRACYVFSGGGSGGHLYPGIAVAEILRRRDPDCDIVFVGSDRPVERSILQPTGFEHHPLPARPPAEFRRSPLRLLRDNWSACRQAANLLKSKPPRCVIGLGGFASVPAVWMAHRFHIPIVLIEQNALPGAATRWMSRWARHICLTFDETRRHLRAGLPTVITGNPLRSAITAMACQQRPVSPDDQRTLLILGGSQGAESLNDAVALLLSEYPEEWQGWRIIHQTGAGRAEKVRHRYRRICRVFEANQLQTAPGFSAPTESCVEDESPADQCLSRALVVEFLPNIAEWYAQADLVISRSGATTLAELACVGCPSLLVPYPFAADRHQAANAEAFAKAGSAIVIPQSTSPKETADRLRGPLFELLRDAKRRELMSRAAKQLARPDAASRIADLIDRIFRAGGVSPLIVRESKWKASTGG